MLFAPVGHEHEYGAKALAVARERIFDARRDLGEDVAVHDAVALEFAEMLGKHFFRADGNQALELAEAPRFVFEIKQDERFPFAADDLGGEFHGTFEIVHASSLSDTREEEKIPGVKKVPTSWNGTLA